MSNAYVPDKERSTNGHCRTSRGYITDKTNMYRIRNGQNVYRTVKERIYRSQRIKRISSDIDHEVHTRYCVHDRSFSKVFINMNEYVNKIICILNYGKIEHYTGFHLVPS